VEIDGITTLTEAERALWDWPEDWVDLERERRAYVGRKHWQQWLTDWKARCGAPGAGFSVDEAGAVVAGNSGEVDLDLLQRLIPWRKGPWRLGGESIDAEWRSEWKWDRIAEAVAGLPKRSVADVGGGNGYYAFRLLDAGAGRVTVFDPTEKSYLQAAVARYAAGAEDRLALSLGGEDDLVHFEKRYDLILCMGVQYHRRDPWSMMQRLFNALQPGGTLIFETLIWPGDDAVGFMPPGRYCGMRNVWLLPTRAGIASFASRAGFKPPEFIHTGPTLPAEQRLTPWTFAQSLGDWLDPADPTKTIEGWHAPCRSIALMQR
jgi:tRNA (mo5U34)-methyltransferase